MNDTATQTGNVPIVYNIREELSPHEAKKVLELACAVKRGEKDKGLIELAFGKKDELYIVGLKKAA